MTRMRARCAKVFAAMWLALAWAIPTRAQEIWVPPTLQADTGGLGVANNGIWPVTPVGAVRLAFAVPNDLQTFQNAKVVLIPNSPGGSSLLVVYACAAKQSDSVVTACAGPFSFPFAGVTNRLSEINITTALSTSVSLPGQNYIAVLAYTTPTSGV